MIFKALTTPQIIYLKYSTTVQQYNRKTLKKTLTIISPGRFSKKKKKTQLGFDLNAGETMSMIPTANSNPIWIRITSNQYKHIKIIPFRASEVGINYKLVGG